MFGKRLFLCVMLSLLTPVAACTSTLALPAVRDPDLLYQTSTLSALSAGDFEGVLSIGELRAYGDFGLGTYNALDGEMVVLDGQVYQIRDDGVPQVAGDDALTPYAAVTSFAADQTLTVSEAADCPTFQQEIDSQLPALDQPYAVKVSGEFSTIKVRAPHRQSPPYPILTDALADPAIFELQNISGTMVGFRLPEYMAGANSAGYHFHFVSDDKLHGGHVLECRPAAVTVEIDTIDRIEIDVTSDLAEP
jgi:acetolactate decarboxylase